MLGIGLLILAIVAAYFIYKSFSSSHLTRCQYDQRTSEHVPESVKNFDRGSVDYQAEFAHLNDQHPNLPNSTNPVPHENPSLLYADRKETAQQQADLNNGQYAAGATTSTDSVSTSAGVASSESMTRAENLPVDESLATHDTMDFTAETATLTSEDVGNPANSSDYTPTSIHDDNHSAVQTDAYISEGTTAANAQQHSQNAQDGQQQTQHRQQYSQDNHQQQQPDNNNTGTSAGTAAASVGAVAAGIAGAAGAMKYSSQTNATSQTPSTHDHVQQSTESQGSTGAHPASDGIDLELGDNTYNDGQALQEEHDELLDFGDLTADISEMLKELNLRESDSPRLEINEQEYQQLKTGEPGEVKPEKIENVAGKLRNMLQ